MDTSLLMSRQTSEANTSSSPRKRLGKKIGFAGARIACQFHHLLILFFSLPCYPKANLDNKIIKDSIACNIDASLLETRRGRPCILVILQVLQGRVLWSTSSRSRRFWCQMTRRWSILCVQWKKSFHFNKEKAADERITDLLCQPEVRIHAVISRGAPILEADE